MQTRLAHGPRKPVVWGISLVLITVAALLGVSPGAATATGLATPPRPCPFCRGSPVPAR